MDLAKLSITELNNLKNNIDAELVRRQESEKEKARIELEEFAKARGYTLDELLGKSAKKQRKTGSRKPAGIKYQFPENHEMTWSGRGRQPAWVKDWVASGKPLEMLAVK
ncbi:MAG: H-NS histone family protein [Rhodocyclaceae bacterium]|nr:H-NS histone family protein [Rhodocyclaceae bacterium]